MARAQPRRQRQRHRNQPGILAAEEEAEEVGGGLGQQGDPRGADVRPGLQPDAEAAGAADDTGTGGPGRARQEGQEDGDGKEPCA